MTHKEIKEKLIQGEMLELSGNDNEMLLWKSKKTGYFMAQFNAIPAFGFKTFEAFINELHRWTEKHNLSF